MMKLDQSIACRGLNNGSYFTTVLSQPSVFFRIFGHSFNGFKRT